jgi:acyl-CoA reductase-like NAD-dependent aldehyde dehydrogenase
MSPALLDSGAAADRSHAAAGRLGSSCTALREPVEVAVCIIPWNVAVLMAGWKVTPALATGYAVILKPAEGTSLSALHFGALVDIEDAELSSGLTFLMTSVSADLWPKAASPQPAQLQS